MSNLKTTIVQYRENITKVNIKLWLFLFIDQRIIIKY